MTQKMQRLALQLVRTSLHEELQQVGGSSSAYHHHGRFSHDRWHMELPCRAADTTYTIHKDYLDDQSSI